MFKAMYTTESGPYLQLSDTFMEEYKELHGTYSRHSYEIRYDPIAIKLMEEWKSEGYYEDVSFEEYDLKYFPYMKDLFRVKRNRLDTHEILRLDEGLYEKLKFDDEIQSQLNIDLGNKDYCAYFINIIQKLDINDSCLKQKIECIQNQLSIIDEIREEIREEIK